LNLTPPGRVVSDSGARGLAKADGGSTGSSRWLGARISAFSWAVAHLRTPHGEASIPWGRVPSSPPR